MTMTKLQELGDLLIPHPGIIRDVPSSRARAEALIGELLEEAATTATTRAVHAINSAAKKSEPKPEPEQSKSGDVKDAPSQKSSPKAAPKSSKTEKKRGR